MTIFEGLIKLRLEPRLKLLDKNIIGALRQIGTITPRLDGWKN